MEKVLRFRMGCPNLPIELGRYERPPVPRSHRLYNLCAQAVGDERHLLLECPLLQPIRSQYSALLSRAHLTMRHLLWHHDQMLVFNYIRECINFHDAAIARQPD